MHVIMLFNIKVIVLFYKKANCYIVIPIFEIYNNINFISHSLTIKFTFKINHKQYI